MSLEGLKDRILESPLGYAVWSAPFNKQKAGPVLRMIERAGRSGGRLLDVGCGPGTNAPLLLNWDYLGVDLNPKYIETARHRVPDRRFAVADATRLNVGGSFDLVLINSLMHHLDDDGCLKLLRSLNGLLKDTGQIVIQEPLVPDRNDRIQNFLMDQDRGDHFRTVGHWKDLFAAGGFTVREEEHYKMKLAGVIVGWQMYSALLAKKADRAE